MATERVVLTIEVVKEDDGRYRARLNAPSYERGGPSFARSCTVPKPAQAVRFLETIETKAQRPSGASRTPTRCADTWPDLMARAPTDLVDPHCPELREFCERVCGNSHDPATTDGN